MEEPVIRIANVSKVYRLWNSPGARLRFSALSQILRALRATLPAHSSLLRILRERRENQGREFHALRDISLDLHRGESVGIIGRNGSGKSTLLQIIAGTLAPSSGNVEVRARVAALLELGSGFNLEFTGRENVFLNASLLGLSRAETEARYDQIAAFAEIGPFLEQPVKTYSSGMVVRLAFAVQTAVEPEVLIVDEALSVGDVFFQQRCFRRLHSLREHGTTLLFVSHDLGTVQNLCTRALLLNRGEMSFLGPPEEAATRYYASAATTTVRETRGAADARVEAPVSEEFEATAAGIVAATILGGARSRHGERRLEICAASLRGNFGSAPQVALLGEMHFALLLKANAPVVSPHVGINLYDRMNNLVFSAGNPQLRTEIPDLEAGDRLLLEFTLRFTVQPGLYTFALVASEPVLEDANLGAFHDIHEGLGPIEVINPAPDDVMPFYGLAQLPMQITRITRTSAP